MSFKYKKKCFQNLIFNYLKILKFIREITEFLKIF